MKVLCSSSYHIISEIGYLCFWVRGYEETGVLSNLFSYLLQWEHSETKSNNSAHNEIHLAVEDKWKLTKQNESTNYELPENFHFSTTSLQHVTRPYVDRYTKRGSDAVTTVVYAITLNWPKNGILKLAAPRLVQNSTVTLLGHGQDLQVQNWTESD